MTTRVRDTRNERLAAARRTAAKRHRRLRLYHGLRLADVSCRANAPKVDAARFKQLADEARRSCVVARALAAVPGTLETTLL